MNNQKYFFSLEDFQKGKYEFKDEDFICYINNPNFYTRWVNVLPNYRKNKFISGLLNKFNGLVKPTTIGNNILFVGYTNKSIDSLKTIFEILNSTKKILDRINVLVLGKGDYEITDEFVEYLPENIKLIFANNINTHNSRARFLPVGRDFRSAEYFSKIRPSLSKNQLCYCNYSLNTHTLRTILYNSTKDKNFIGFEHMGEFLDYPISRSEYFTKVSKSKFNICPRGNGIDTFRLWDSIYLGSIPIVVKEAVFHDYLNDLPILFLDSYQEFENLNKEFLEETYQQMLKKRYNYKKLLFSYWINKIESS